jgi:REP element-mobilizing transposase RayT
MTHAPTERRGYNCRQSGAATIAGGAARLQLPAGRGGYIIAGLKDFLQACGMWRNGRDHPKRPPRLTWLHDSARPFYFITFNTYKRRPILANSGVHQVFAGYCGRAEERGIAVGRYVLMPDHAHLFVALSEDMALSPWIRALKTVVGKELIGRGIHIPHWQQGFFDHVLRSGESYGEKWEYVRMNPVRAGLCRVPEEWKYQGEIVRLEY